jgi:PH domain
MQHQHQQHQQQEPFASFGVPGTTHTHAVTGAASGSLSGPIPTLLSSETSHSSGMSSSASATDAASVVSTSASPVVPGVVAGVQNPFENVVPITVMGGHSPAPPMPPLSLSTSIDSSSLKIPPFQGTPSRTSAPQSTLQVTSTPPSRSPPNEYYRQQEQTHMVFDDDENTAKSSEANTEEQPSTISRFLENTKRRITAANRRDSEDENMQGALIAGYLQKLGRNGKWQTRWFETDGECLSYYKSAKRSKLLATLDLQKVRTVLSIEVFK